jgi:hypothetical protein
MEVDRAYVVLVPLYPAYVSPVESHLLLTFEVWHESIVKSLSPCGQRRVEHTCSRQVV